MSKLLLENPKNIFGNKYPSFIKKINLKTQGVLCTGDTKSTAKPKLNEFTILTAPPLL